MSAERVALVALLATVLVFIASIVWLRVQDARGLRQRRDALARYRGAEYVDLNEQERLLAEAEAVVRDLSRPGALTPSGHHSHPADEAARAPERPRWLAARATLYVWLLGFFVGAMTVAALWTVTQP